MPPECRARWIATTCVPASVGCRLRRFRCSYLSFQCGLFNVRAAGRGRLASSAVPLYRSRRQSSGCGGRRSRRSQDLLCGRGFGWYFQIDRRRNALGADLRRSAGLLDRRARHCEQRSEHCLGGNRRIVHSWSYFRRPRGIQIARCGQDLEFRRTRKDRPHVAPGDRSTEFRSGVLVRARACVRPTAGARRVSNWRRRQELDPGAQSG